MLASHPRCFAHSSTAPPYTEFQIFKYYVGRPCLYLFTYDLFLIVWDWWFNIIWGDLSTLSDIGHTLTNRGMHTKFQIYNVSSVRHVEGIKRTNTGNEYVIKANGLRKTKVRTKAHLDNIS